jgi:hypothetical protein
MKDLTVIIPIVELDNDIKKDLLARAIESVDNSNVLVVGNKEAINGLSNYEALSKFTYGTLVNNTKNCTYAAQVMLALKSVKSKYFTVLEYDDMFSDIWFKNAETYIEQDSDDTFAFFPLTEIVDFKTGESFGYANEAVWASSFSEEIGCYDLQSFEDYFNFNASGAIFKTDDFISLGGLKTSLKLVTWYEFILRALYKGKRLFVIPKVGYFHVVNREDSITTRYTTEMSVKESEWWIDLAKKEYFFPQDRNKTYTEE